MREGIIVERNVGKNSRLSQSIVSPFNSIAIPFRFVRALPGRLSSEVTRKRMNNSRY